MERWTGKIAVVTGGCSGMGAATLRRLTKEGLKVINLDISVSENSVDENGMVFNRKCDVANIESIRENFEWIESQFGAVHILVNCAGCIVVNPVIDASEEGAKKVEKVLNINVHGTIHCTREAMKLMISSDDYCLIVNICSVKGHSIPYTGYSLGAYHVSKHAIRAFSETIRQELCHLKNEKIRVTNLSPGGVMTRMIATVAASLTQAQRGASSSAKFLKADNVAETIMFLLTTPYDVNITELTIRPTAET